MSTRQRSSAVRRRAPRWAPSDRRAHLLEYAVQVFARRGIAAARPAEVADAAGVSESTVFVYFATRDDLVCAVLDEVERFYMERNHRFLAEHAIPAPASILRLGATFADSVDSHPDHARVWLDWSNSVGDTIFPRYLDYQERVIEMVTSTLLRGRAAGVVSQDVVPEDAARILYSSAQMVVQMKLTGQSQGNVNRFLISSVRAVIGCAVDPNDIPARIAGPLTNKGGGCETNIRPVAAAGVERQTLIRGDMPCSSSSKIRDDAR